LVWAVEYSIMFCSFCLILIGTSCDSYWRSCYHMRFEKRKKRSLGYTFWKRSLKNYWFSRYINSKQECILSGTTNKMQRFTVFFIIVNTLHVSGGFFVHHQELKNCIHSIWYVPGLLAATVSLAASRNRLTMHGRMNVKNRNMKLSCNK
jgi:hypothetical protein